MTGVIAVFSSRTESVYFYNKLKEQGVNCILVNTPAAARIGCGISVKIPLVSVPLAKRMLAQGKYSGFRGFVDGNSR